MQLAAPQLASHLQRGLRSLYTVHGDELLLQQEALDLIRQKARIAGYAERSVHTVAGAHFDWSAVLASQAEQSLFAEQRVVEVRIPSGKPGTAGAQILQKLAQASEGNDSTLTLVTLPRLDKASKSSAWFTALGQYGVTIQVDQVGRQALPQWIAQRLMAHGLQVEPASQGERTLQFFADRVEGNLLAAHQEVEKLALLYPVPEGQQRELTLDEVQRAVLNVARYDVFKLSEAVLAGQGLRVQRMIDGLQAEGVAEVLVHHVLAEDIRALHRAKDAIGQGKPLPMVLREQRVWGARELLFERALPRLSAAALAQLLQDAHRVDGIAKGLPRPDWPANAWQALSRLAQQLCALCAGKSQAANRIKVIEPMG